MRRAVQTFGVWEKTERATQQCEYCKLWFAKVDARHYRTCIFIPGEERRQKLAWLEELKKDRKRVAERERYARKRKLAVQVPGQPQSQDNVQFLPQGPILNNEENLMDGGLDDMCMSYGGEASADAQMGMDGVTQEEVQQDEEFVDSHLTRALCDVIQDVNQKKADNLLKSIHRILRESGRTKFAQAFKDLKTFQDCVASASQRTQLKATKVLTAAGIQCYVYHVSDAKQLLHEMLLKVGQVSTRPETCTTEDGASRAYGQVVYGSWMRETYHKIQELSPGAELLPIAFYSDKTLTSSSRSLYPVNLFLPSANKHSVHKGNSYRCIGLVPEPPIVTGVLTTKKKFFKSLRKWLTYTAMQIILEPFKEISKTGIVLNIDGIEKKYYPIPVFYVADLLEYQTIFGISASVSVPDSFPDPSYLVRTKDLDLNQEFMSIPKRRSEENTLKRIEIAQRMNRSGASEEAVHKLKKFSLDPLLLYSPKDDCERIFKGKKIIEFYWGEGMNTDVTLPVSGFHLTNCFDLVVPDKLHTLDSGIGSMLYCTNPEQKNSLFNICMNMSGRNRSTITEIMNQTVEDSSPWPNYSLPTSKFRDPENRKIKISSEQSANLRRLALIACLADEALYPIIPPLKAYLDVEECINRKIHTDESLSRMHELIKKLRQEMLRAWSTVSQDLNLKILKWFSLYKFVYEVKRSGCASVTDTHHHERTHKDIKKASGFTNNHLDTLMGQTIAKSIRIAQTKDLISSSGAARKYKTIRQRCIANKALTIVKSPMLVSNMMDLNESIKPFQAYCPEMARLKYCVEVLYRVNLRQTSKHVSLPLDTKIEIYSGAYIPYHQTPGSDMDAKKILGRVAIIDQVNKVRNRFKQGECQESEERQEIDRLVQRLGSFVTAKGNTLSEEWYAEVICFVRVTPPPTARMETHETAFVRWYKEVKATEIHDRIGLPVLQLEKTTRPSAADSQIQTEPFTDLSLTRDLMQPVFLQRVPGTQRKWYMHNKYVR